MIWPPLATLMTRDRAIDGSAPKVGTGALDLAGVHPHPNPQAEVSEPPLRVHRGLHGCVRRPERRRDPVAKGGEHRSPCQSHLVVEDREVSGDELEHVGRLLPPAGRSFDVGEQEGHRRAGGAVGGAVGAGIHGFEGLKQPTRPDAVDVF